MDFISDETAEDPRLPLAATEPEIPPPPGGGSWTWHGHATGWISNDLPAPVLPADTQPTEE